jgi:nucleotide-binding universal stress UspA family protein
MQVRKVLFCTDFSENSIPARGWALELAKAFQAELNVLHVVNPSPLPGSPPFTDRIPVDMALLQREVEQGVQEQLNIIIQECGETSGLDVDNMKPFLRTGSPAEQIVAFAREESVDTIVIGTHGWTGFKALIMGSVAENVVRTATCPVLTVRAPAGDEE